ncbi:NAD(P)-dependent dehydrogenase (short-subunit alcohol dehydrogenase family) [Murinocardiopsis flavida]|uniref:NAD(P)-dependent dehydrogenase (Short-subunit alcohol dehydrogenase family) n=1 Tax=Murinocardiopsis flavida TaxID=645275 RepID=A0A2P8CZ91_9ACTN|nr:SDR family oxidoreductase [Murinocardiopsis flavida]PSK90257.1 NAD(P)-dependent dehydrogenase (short-subunit alcohol dehydrogenase family) [Murinocardiopsis flavida]
MDLRLTDRVAVVTGASKGIGLATTRLLLDEGARVVAVSRKSTPGLDALAGPALVHVSADLMDPDAPAQAVARAVEEFGGLDILVNNAGGPPPGTTMPQFGFMEPGDDDWRAMFEFNLFSAVRAVRAAVPAMLARGGGAIVNVSSAHARQPSGVNVDYGAAKAGLSALTKSLSEEFGPQGIRVNTVTPGPVRTPWWTEEGGAADVFAAAVGTDRDTVMDTAGPEMMRLTIGRLLDPREVADAIVQLASPRSAGTTGADVVVDAGMLKEV